MEKAWLNYFPGQIRSVDELEVGRFYLLICLLGEFTVTLIRVIGAPKKLWNTHEWYMAVRELTPKGEKKCTIALADYGIIPNSSDAENWGYFQCLLRTNATTLPPCGDAAELLDPEEREQLQAKVTEVEMEGEVKVDFSQP